MEIYEEIARLRKEGKPCALAVIVQCMGSSPQKEGAKMLVKDDGSTEGTLGGGCIEAEVIQLALASMRDGAPSSVPFNLTENHGDMVCGGKMLVYIEPIIPEPRLVILGAGHVGKALASVARFSGFHVTVADDREEYANRLSVPDAHNLVVSAFERVFSAIAADRTTHIVIATRGHNHDLDALKASLATDACYIGLVGSRRKRALLFKTLREAGFPESEIARVIVPVGLPIGSVTPEEIAISIMGQIILQRRNSASPRISHSSCSGLIQKNGTYEATPPA
ncbi:MAG TPA: XdhC/CoxI family protein [Dissulfurispiraceae bacterium]